MTKRITLITGSTLGNAEYVTEQLELKLCELGFNPNIKHGPSFDETDLTGLYLVICSTHGAGELPENLQPWLNDIEIHQPDCRQLQFGAIGLGSSDYDLFCGAIKQIEQILVSLGATRIGDRLEIDAQDDLLPEEIALEWLEDWLNQHIQPIQST